MAVSAVATRSAAREESPAARRRLSASASLFINTFFEAARSLPSFQLQPLNLVVAFKLACNDWWLTQLSRLPAARIAGARALLLSEMREARLEPHVFSYNAGCRLAFVRAGTVIY